MSKIRSPYKDCTGTQLYEGDRCRYPDWGSDGIELKIGTLCMGVTRGYWYFDNANGQVEISDFTKEDWKLVKKLNEMNSTYHDVEMAKTMALHFAQVHNIKYNVVVMNPDKDGNYSKEQGSTYEIILDSGLGKTNIRKITDTDELKKLKKIPTIKYKGQ